MRQNDDTPYREGVVVDIPIEKGQGSFVDVGLTENIKVDKQLKAGVRVTVKIEKSGKLLLFNFYKAINTFSCNYVVYVITS